MEIDIRRSWSGGVEFIFFEHRDGKTYVCKPMQIIMEPTGPDGSFSGPSLKFDGVFGDIFLLALAEALDKSGVKTDKDAKIAGTLEATKYHLEDLRKIVFKSR